MDWETPRFEEIKMDAEFTAYADALEPDDQDAPTAD